MTRQTKKLRRSEFDCKNENNATRLSVSQTIPTRENQVKWRWPKVGGGVVHDRGCDILDGIKLPAFLLSERTTSVQLHEWIPCRWRSIHYRFILPRGATACVKNSTTPVSHFLNLVPSTNAFLVPTSLATGSAHIIPKDIDEYIDNTVFLHYQCNATSLPWFQYTLIPRKCKAATNG